MFWSVCSCCPHGGRGKYAGRTYPRKNDQPLFEEPLQTSRDFFELDNDFKKSRDVCLDCSKSGWTFFSCPHCGREHVLEFVLAVRTVVGTNILDARILEKMTNHFLRNPYKRPGILSNRNPI